MARCLRGSACHRTLECNRGHTSGGALAGDGISLHYQPRLSTSEIDSIERCFGKSRGADVVEVLERLGRQVGFPTTIRVDQGPEFVSRDLDLWAYQRGVTLDFSRPGKPTDNAFIEAFNSRFRAECLDAHWFMSLADAQKKLEDWRKYYNEERPHGAIGQQTPIMLLNHDGAASPPS